MTQLFANNAVSVLTDAVAPGDSTITVANGSVFPTPAGGDYFLLTLVGVDGNNNESSWEIVKCTTRAGNVLTIVRAQEGTSAGTWSISTKVELRLTAGSVAAKQDILGYTPINKAGDTLTGQLKAVGDPSVDADLARKKYVDDGLATKQASLGYTPVNVAGDTITGQIWHNNDSDVNEDNFVVSTNTKSNAYYAYKVRRGGVDVAGLKVDGTADFVRAYTTNQVPISNNELASKYYVDNNTPDFQDPKLKGDIYFSGRSRYKVVGMGESNQINLASGNFFVKAMSGNVTLSLTNIPTGAYGFILEIGYTSGALTLPANWSWANGVAPILSPGTWILSWISWDVLGVVTAVRRG